MYPVKKCGIIAQGCVELGYVVYVTHHLVNGFLKSHLAVFVYRLRLFDEQPHLFLGVFLVLF